MSFLSPQGSAAHSGGPEGRFTLQRPVSIAIYNSYQDAQHAVDYLADQRFPVQNLSIVGTDLKSFERITGGLTWGKVLSSSAMSGVVWGIMASLFLWLFIPNINPFVLLVSSLMIFVAANMITSAIGYRMTGGRRDFTSTTQIIATHYEVLGEAEVAGQARAMLSGSQNQANAHRTAQTGGQGYAPHPAQAPQQPQSGNQAPQARPAETSSFPPPAWPAPAAGGTGTSVQGSATQGTGGQGSAAPASGQSAFVPGQTPARSADASGNAAAGGVQPATGQTGAGQTGAGQSDEGQSGTDLPPTAGTGTFDPTGGRDQS